MPNVPSFAGGNYPNGSAGFLIVLAFLLIIIYCLVKCGL